VAIIQNKHRILNKSAKELSGFSKQVHENFFEVLVEESGHEVFTAESLESYLEKYSTDVDVVICAPFPDIGNVAPAFALLGKIREAFPNASIIVWSDRPEEAIRQTSLTEYGAVAYYTGTLIDAANDFADLIFKYSST
ncbi:MAG: hypothetical protein CUN55_10375, partial [Phototrophicales bacterium]